MDVFLWGLWVFYVVSIIKYIKFVCSFFGDWGFGFDNFFGWEGLGMCFGCYWF